MFKCDNCGKTTEPREKMNLRTSKVRNKSYGVPSKKDKYIEATGTEIVEQQKLCKECFDN